MWVRNHRRYRAEGRAQTAHERDLLATANWDAFRRHYNERVPTIEEEFDLWGAYHQHRHEMRYDLVAAAVRKAVPPGALVLDVGCGSALVGDRLDGYRYVGVDFGGHHVRWAAAKHPGVIGQAPAEQLPFADGAFDVVVMSEVIEHLLRPELAVWEVARVLKRGGTFVMTTNNASELPLRSPLTHPLSWLEKAVGATRDDVISRRPWVWPEPVDPSLLPEGAPPVYLPHTHHIQAETRRLFAAAGLDTVAWSSFEFPPPQSTTARWLEARGAIGRHAVDRIEWVARRVPLVNRLGCHLLMVARKVGPPVALSPPGGVWPGPFSG
jgi:SAM-dependent methyltransferase